MFRVIKSFTDGQTRQSYQKGDNFPRRGQVTEERVEELCGKENKLGESLIVPFDVVIKSGDKTSSDEHEKEGAEDPTNEHAPAPEDEGAPEKSEFPKHTGGAWYELSNGEKIQGKEEAVQAEKELE